MMEVVMKMMRRRRIRGRWVAENVLIKVSYVDYLFKLCIRQAETPTSRVPNIRIELICLSIYAI